MGREFLHAVLQDLDVPRTPHRRGGLLPWRRKLWIVSATVNDSVLTTLLNDRPFGTVVEQFGKRLAGSGDTGEGRRFSRGSGRATVR